MESYGQHCITSTYIDNMLMPQTVVQIDPETIGDDLWFGIHIGHKANTPELTPFCGIRKLTRYITVEYLEQRNSRLIIRAYPGTYSPPLPWMGTAEKSPYGLEFCQDYWRNHAYSGHKLIKSDTGTFTPPLWWLELNPQLQLA